MHVLWLLELWMHLAFRFAHLGLHNYFAARIQYVRQCGYLSARVPNIREYIFWLGNYRILQNIFIWLLAFCIYGWQTTLSLFLSLKCCLANNAPRASGMAWSACQKQWCQSPQNESNPHISSQKRRLRCTYS